MYKNFGLIVCLFFLLTFSACVHFAYLFHTPIKYKLTNYFIQSNRSFATGFKFSELVVDSVNSSGIPIRYQRTSSAELFIENSNSRQSKRIYFYKPNKNYWWAYQQQWRLSVLPIKMQKNNWYMIERLLYSGDTRLNIFIYVDGFGNCYRKGAVTTP